MESADRTRDNLDTFKERLKKYRNKYRTDSQKENPNAYEEWPDIEVHDPECTRVVTQPSLSSPVRAPDDNNIVDPHQWLTIMDRFAEGIKTMKPYDTGESLPQELRKPVKIALIDDGVELTHRNLTGRIYGGWSCDAGYTTPDFEGIKRPYGNSASNHGTLMACMICRVCPQAQIFVFRLDVYDGDERSHFTAKSAADVCAITP